jgi:general secretion pathway protein D
MTEKISLPGLESASQSLLSKLFRKAAWVLLFLAWILILPPLDSAWASDISFTFKDTEIQYVLKKTSELTNIPFIFNPQQVQGKITILAPQRVSPEEALKLLQSALALHGYALLRLEESIWVMPAGRRAAQGKETFEVIKLDYADASELAHTLSHIAPYEVIIVPYPPTNSLIIRGNPEKVQELIYIIKGKTIEDLRVH